MKRNALFRSCFNLLPTVVQNTLSVVVSLLGVAGISALATVTAAWLVVELIDISTPKKMVGTPSTRQDIQDVIAQGPSLADIKDAAQKAVEARYAATAGYNHKAAVDMLRVYNRQPTTNPSVWAVQMTMLITMEPIDPEAEIDPVKRGKGEDTKIPPPRWVKVAWSGERWFIPDFPF